MFAQLLLPFPHSDAALAAIDLWVKALERAEPAPELDAETFAELDTAGDLDALDALERERWAEEGTDHDWADPDSFDAETNEWYDRFSDCRRWSDDAAVDEPSCEFFLGTHRPHWIYEGKSRESRPKGPLFVSARQMLHARHTEYPSCDTAFAVDSGGFTELRQHGGWVTSPESYAAQVRSLSARTGTFRWAASQDWMVEDDALARTGKTVQEHQELTVANFLRLRELAPEVRWLPVIQGQTLAQYLAHVELYAAAGVYLPSFERVGVGSVCRRQSSDEICEILRELAARGLRCHGFGVKTAGLEKAAAYLASADSLAWSLGARKRFPGAQNSQAVAEEYRARMCSIDGVKPALDFAFHLGVEDGD